MFINNSFGKNYDNSNKEKYLKLLKRIAHKGLIKANEHNKVIWNVQ